MILMQGVRDKGHTAKIRLDPTYTPDEDESKIKREARQHKNKKDKSQVGTLVPCMRCPRAFHSNCIPPGSRYNQYCHINQNL